MSNGAGQYDAIIIGSGIGGLVCGAFLARAGKRVIVFERHYLAGGYCTSFKRRGFVFDAAVHHIGGCGRLSITGRALRELGIELELKRLDPMDSLIFPDFSIDIPADLDEFIALLQQRYPHEAENIPAFFKQLTRLYWAILQENEQSPMLERYGHMKFSQMLDEFFRDPQLKLILGGQWGYLGLPPEEISAVGMCQMMVNYLKDGAYFPKGGSQRFADAIVAALKRYGGQLKLRTEVQRILLEDGRATGVLLKSGQEVRAPLVVSNADARLTFLHLLAEQVDGGYLDDLKNMRESTPLYMIWFGLTAEADLSPIKRGFHFMKTGEWYYISVPTRDDPGLAPAGKQIVSVTASFESEYDRVEDWRALKQAKKQQMVDYLQTLVPDFVRHIVVTEVGSPYTCWRYTLNSKGAAYGWAVTPDQSGPRRLSHRTPIPNLYLTGHWTQPGPGVCAVVSSGWRVANLILKDEAR